MSIIVRVAPINGPISATTATRSGNLGLNVFQGSRVGLGVDSLEVWGDMESTAPGRGGR